MISVPAKKLLARDVMVTKLITLRPEMDAVEAIRTLLHHKISGAPVVDSAGNYLGVFSERSALSFVLGLACDQLPSSQVSVFMSTDRGCTICEETDLLSIAQRFSNGEHRRLPVLRGDQLVGQISRRDVLQAALGLIDQQPQSARSSLLYLSALVKREDSPL